MSEPDDPLLRKYCIELPPPKPKYQPRKPLRLLAIGTDNGTYPLFDHPNGNAAVWHPPFYVTDGTRKAAVQTSIWTADALEWIEPGSLADQTFDHELFAGPLFGGIDPATGLPWPEEEKEADLCLLPPALQMPISEGQFVACMGPLMLANIFLLCERIEEDAVLLLEEDSTLRARVLDAETMRVTPSGFWMSLDGSLGLELEMRVLRRAKEVFYRELQRLDYSMLSPKALHMLIIMESIALDDATVQVNRLTCRYLAYRNALAEGGQAYEAAKGEYHAAVTTVLESDNLETEHIFAVLNERIALAGGPSSDQFAIGNIQEFREMLISVA